MLNSSAIFALSAERLNTTDNPELQRRLALYQVFLRLYEQNRGLLEEILSLENGSSKALASVTLPYIQGLVLRQQIYLVTNILGNGSQSLTQSQNLWIIGRDSQRVNLPISDKRLSRRHAAIRYVNGYFYLVDLGSRNGSYINGEPVRRCMRLKDGDRIRLGSLSFAFFICNFMQSPPQLSADIPSPHDAVTAAQRQGNEEEEITTNLLPPPSDESNWDARWPDEDTSIFLQRQQDELL
ncbi:FHA domain-containing protein [Vacuolonema iberomarrocanum]|uniref:FHA domain-containing protein n=1 Tax=Vacuolonema iberomarrocanum TaxID=3454632 RepID=UPI0019FDCCF8|nr:FHA domain-containing protein [filamentous cyanobacterium LEGE 07170]